MPRPFPLLPPSSPYKSNDRARSQSLPYTVPKHALPLSIHLFQSSADAGAVPRSFASSPSYVAGHLGAVPVAVNNHVELTRGISLRLLKSKLLNSSRRKSLRKMARTKQTPCKRVIRVPQWRTRFTMGKRLPPHLVEVLRNEMEEPQEVQPVEAPMEEPLEDEMEEEPMEDEPMEDESDEELIVIVDSDEEPVEEEQQGGHEGAGDPDDGDDSDSSDSDEEDDGNSHNGEGVDGENGDGAVGENGDGADGENGDGAAGGGGGDDGGNGGDIDIYTKLLADGWLLENYFDLQGDSYYHQQLVSLVRRFHPRCTVQYKTDVWTHPDYTGFCETMVYIREGSRVCYIHRAVTSRLTREAAIQDAARQALLVNRDRHFYDIQWEEYRYLPRRRSGESTCKIAAPMGEVNFRLPPTLEHLAHVNTDLDQTLDEMNALAKAYVQLCHEHAVLKRQLEGTEPTLPVLAVSPLRIRGGHGDPSTSTNVDP